MSEGSNEKRGGDAAAARGSGTELVEVSAQVRGWIGKPRYEEETEFEIERGYIATTCASVQNANPLFWDDEVAEALTGGVIAPPTMLSVWFRPHYWAPGRSREQQPLQVHFDLKEKLALPEAVITENEIEFGEPVRPGDKLFTRQILESVSEPKTTKLGTGRFWVIHVEYQNQRAEFVGRESYTAFGYRKETQ
ncbi:MAG: MaoC family dehydratase N-terminal domain-containing protein [Myxococcota bacterium]